jgi:hypothetical protein
MSIFKIDELAKLIAKSRQTQLASWRRHRRHSGLHLLDLEPNIQVVPSALNSNMHFSFRVHHFVFSFGAADGSHTISTVGN